MSASARTPDLVDDLFRAGFVNLGDNHVGALGSELERDGAAHPAPRTRDDRGLAAEPHFRTPLTGLHSIG